MNLLAIALVTILPTSPVAVSNTYTFTLTGDGFTASGTLLANSNGNGTSTAMSGKGTLSGKGLPANQQGALTLVPNPRGVNYSYYKSSGINYDNQIAALAPQEVDFFGLLFVLPNGIIFNVFSTGPGEYMVLQVSGSDWLLYDSVEFKLTPH